MTNSTAPEPQPNHAAWITLTDYSPSPYHAHAFDYLWTHAERIAQRRMEADPEAVAAYALNLLADFLADHTNELAATINEATY